MTITHADDMLADRPNRKVKEGAMRRIFLVLAMAVMAVSPTHAQQCGDPPRVDDQSLKGELEGKAKLLTGWIGDAGLKGQIETARTDILSKYPDAAKLHSDTYLLYMFCTFVLADPKLAAPERLRAIEEFQQSISKPPSVTAAQPSSGDSTSITTHGQQSPVVKDTKGDVNMNFGVPPRETK
jgi:hypothetical protein